MRTPNAPLPPRHRLPLTLSDIFTLSFRLAETLPLPPFVMAKRDISGRRYDGRAMAQGCRLGRVAISLSGGGRYFCFVSMRVVSKSVEVGAEQILTSSMGIGGEICFQQLCAKPKRSNSFDIHVVAFRFIHQTI